MELSTSKFKVIALAKCVLTILELKNWNQHSRDKTKLNICYQNPHVVNTNTKQVISRSGKNENGCEIFRNEKCTRKVCKALVLRSKFVIC